jgi:hypothetical protein
MIVFIAVLVLVMLSMAAVPVRHSASHPRRDPPNY